jgi:fibronectin-binding autotransporter adhesin
VRRRCRANLVFLGLLVPVSARASVGVEQIEANESTTGYAAIDFGGVPTVTETTGEFAGITFQAVDPTAITDTLSSHAMSVGGDLYSITTVAYPYVGDVYAASANTFIPNVVQPQDWLATNGPLPGHFSTGAQVINNSYVDSENSNLDALRRWDFMIQRDNVTFVTAAVIDNGSFAGDYLDWSAFNSLAVSSPALAFSPTGSPGKQHADIWANGLTSFATGTVSGYAAGLYGNAQVANQADAQNDVVVRSLLMAGADKVNYTRDTANNLSAVYGAGEADYNSSLSLLQGGEQSIQSVSSVTGAISGSLTTCLKGWAFGAIPSAGQSVIMFHAANTITGITASLNWDVTSPSTATTLNTSSPEIFPDLNLQVLPVVVTNGHYALGASLGDTTLQSNATHDNVQYIYSTSTLAAGNYAFVISGDPTLSPNVGFSYNVVSAATTNQWTLSSGGSWALSSDWSNGVPNSAGAQANLLATPSGLTAPGSIQLNGNTIVGELTFDDSASYTIVPGSGGTLTINDAGDAGGAYPCITVILGSHTITAPVSLANGVTVNTTAGNGLTITGNVTGVGGLTLAGKGFLTLNGLNSYGDTTVNGGTLTINSFLNSTNVTVSTGATLIANGILSTDTLTSSGTVNFGANTGTTVVAVTLGSLNINGGGLVTLNPATSNGSRTVLVTSALAISGSPGTWTGKLDLNNNDMIVKNGNLANVVSLVTSGFNAHSGYWNGNGIVSTSAATNTTYLTTLGAIQNMDSKGNPIYGTGGTYGLFDGQSPTTADVLVKYTYYGDADLNGVVNGSDYAKIDMGFQMHLTGWLNGDFNYDGVVNGSDYALIDNAYNQQGSGLSQIAKGALLAADSSVVAQTTSTQVPEPGVAMLCGAAAIVGLLRRRRKQAAATNS